MFVCLSFACLSVYLRISCLLSIFLPALSVYRLFACLRINCLPVCLSFSPPVRFFASPPPYLNVYPPLIISPPPFIFLGRALRTKTISSFIHPAASLSYLLSLISSPLYRPRERGKGRGKKLEEEREERGEREGRRKGKREKNSTVLSLMDLDTAMPFPLTDALGDVRLGVVLASILIWSSGAFS